MKVYSRMQMILQAAVFFSVGLTAAWDKEDEPADVHLDLAAEDLYLATDPPVPRERREVDDLELGSGDELTTQAPSYPTQPPNTEGAVYTFTVGFKITNMNLTDFNETMEQSFIDVLTTSFNGTAGFEEIVITSKTQGSVNVETECRSNAAEANEEDDEVFKSAFLDACQAVNKKSTVFAVQNDTESWVEAAAEALNTTLSLCNAQNVICPWGYKCIGSTCEHHCSSETCGGKGICTVHGISGDIVCKCESDNFYNYSGEKCSEAELRWEMVLAISGGVGGAIVVLLVTFLGIMYCRHRRSKEISSENSEYTESERRTRVYQRWDTMRSSRGFGRNMFMPSFFASTASPGATPSYKLHRSEGRTGSVWGANEIDEQFPDFVPRLDHIDTEVDYTINRPQLRL